MKNFTLALAAALAATFSANAEIAQVDTVEIVNPSFELADANVDDSGMQAGRSMAHLVGWNYVAPNEAQGSWWAQTNNLSAPCEGRWRARLIQANGSTEPGTTIEQTVECPVGGTYALSAAVVASRNGMRGNIGDGTGDCYVSLYMYDECDDAMVAENTQCYNRIGETGGAWIYKYLVYTTTSEEPTLKIGFGILPHSVGIGKGCLEVDNFVLTYYPGATQEEVVAHLQAIAADKADVTAVPEVANNKYYNLMGVEIAQPTTAGIYIHNGKKFIVK